MNANSFDWRNARQLSILQSLLAVFAPSAFAFVGFHAVLPAVVRNGTPVLIAYSWVAGAMLLIFVLIALFLLRREAKEMGLSLWTRMCLKKISLKQWAICLGLAVLSVVLAAGVQGIIPPVLNAVGFTIPGYMPFFLNPSVNAATAEMNVVSPGLALTGQYGLLPLIGLVLILNILSEELYFRAWMLPKLSRFGGWSWVLNGVLFALYHTFQLWLLPVLLISSLMFAFICYKSKSIWPAFVAHLVGNVLLSILGILALIAA
ncbi:MAG: CPBP family intramembrane metalloprotease [Anaerolineales bacterium]|nr:CPBP family intramembrane metalloprotease [Anaerolineales bacterium]